MQPSTTLKRPNDTKESRKAPVTKAESLIDLLGSLNLQRCGAESISVAEEEHALAFTNCALGWLNPLAPAGR